MKYHYHQPRGRACSAIGTDSVIEPFDCSYLLDSTMDKRGYVAIDDENKEIIVTFPGVPASGLLFENTSLAPVPWQEPLDETTNHPPTPTTTTTTTTAQTRSSLLFNTSTTKHHHLDNAYVLECAVAAWRRCELAVATSLMRICRVAPDDYRVVIIGHSLGGGNV
ncbi:hypothetical protein BDB00DRAFT_818993 [Zychaea mexicana]|uniref:uncharacterized protein n=1 Tax=Zychaea mexicana TaxID=64656 RepID=UPI0022FDFAEC|nr:uncharacterized protein BDB00DRAFT_818993 [Zychaea mexicana]KAI9494392.1 hypothetical protein BDB00DRAFT_818993 [Zychaea mexicana]